MGSSIHGWSARYPVAQITAATSSSLPSAKRTVRPRGLVQARTPCSMPYRGWRTSPNRLRSAVVPDYSVKALGESTWPAFAALVERNNGVFGGCWCMGFHEDSKGTVPPKRERKLARVRAGTAHAALVFDGDDCLGWCQFGTPNEVPRIKNRGAYEKGPTKLPDWRIACNFVGKGHRRQGVATAALAGALDLIADLGGGRVEGYPEAAGSIAAGFLFHGALSTYEQMGFVRQRQIGKHRWVVSRVVEPLFRGAPPA